MRARVVLQSAAICRNLPQSAAGLPQVCCNLLQSAAICRRCDICVTKKHPAKPKPDGVTNYPI